MAQVAAYVPSTLVVIVHDKVKYYVTKEQFMGEPFVKWLDNHARFAAGGGMESTPHQGKTAANRSVLFFDTQIRTRRH